MDRITIAGHDFQSAREMLPEGFIEERNQRKEKVAENTELVSKSMEEMNTKCRSMAQEFKVLELNFEKKSKSYSRLKDASAENLATHESLNQRLVELSHELKTGAENFRNLFAG